MITLLELDLDLGVLMLSKSYVVVWSSERCILSLSVAALPTARAAKSKGKGEG